MRPSFWLKCVRACYVANMIMKCVQVPESDGSRHFEHKRKCGLTGGEKTIGTKGCSKQQCSYLFKGNDPNETSNTGDVGVVKAQQGEDGVRLEGRQQQS